MYQLLFVSPSSLTRIHYLSCIPPLLGESTNILSHLPLLRIYIILTRNLPIFIQINNPQSKIHTQISNHNLFHSAATSILQFFNSSKRSFNFLFLGA